MHAANVTPMEMAGDGRRTVAALRHADKRDDGRRLQPGIRINEETSEPENRRTATGFWRRSTPRAPVLHPRE